MEGALKLAVAAYDGARCKSHGPFEQPMSERNRETIAPMIMAAVEAYNAATAADQPSVAAALVVLARRFNMPPDIQDLLVRGNPAMGVPPGALAAAVSAACIGSGRNLADANSKSPTHDH